MTSAADRKSVRAAEKAARLVEVQRLDFTRHIMSTAPGRQWMWDVLTRCHVFANPYSPEPITTAFACGEMNIGQLLLADIMLASPDNYIQAMREANERRTLAEQRGSQNAGRDVEGRVDAEDGSASAGDSEPDYDIYSDLRAEAANGSYHDR